MKKPKCILLDVEGTTSSISFVYDVMFPFVRNNLTDFLTYNWNSKDVTSCLPLLAKDLGYDSQTQWLGENESAARNRVATGVISLMDDDVKATGLKQLQGAIWKSGFESGELIAHLFEDVAPAIKKWTDAGIEVRVYSSGSIQAQQLFFGHCVAGDMLGLISGHYDTTIGSKKESASYIAIAEDIGISASDVLFVSDVPEELDAAGVTGIKTMLCLRPGNAVVSNENDYKAIRSFSDIEFEPVVSNG